jgi:hypothetical protein
MPTRGSISLETHICLQSRTDGIKNSVLAVSRKPIIQARNELWNRLRTVREDLPVVLTGEIFVLWLDTDSYWVNGTWKAFTEILRAMPGVDLLGGFFCTRNPFSTPSAFRSTTDCDSFPRVGIDCEAGEIVEVRRIGFHFVMHRLSLLDKLTTATPFTPQNEGLGEDFAFCDALIAAGGRIGCATGIPIAHVDVATGMAYMPGTAAMIAEGSSLRSDSTVTQNAEGALVGTEIRDYGITLTNDQQASIAKLNERNDEVLKSLASVAPQVVGV